LCVFVDRFQPHCFYLFVLITLHSITPLLITLYLSHNIYHTDHYRDNLSFTTMVGGIFYPPVFFTLYFPHSRLIISPLHECMQNCFTALSLAGKHSAPVRSAGRLATGLLYLMSG
jgi:hypothetical protein